MVIFSHFSWYSSIRGLREGPGKILMGVLESPGKVLDFFSVKECEPCLCCCDFWTLLGSHFADGLKVLIMTSFITCNILICVGVFLCFVPMKVRARGDCWRMLLKSSPTISRHSSNVLMHSWQCDICEGRLETVVNIVILIASITNSS